MEYLDNPEFFSLETDSIRNRCARMESDVVKVKKRMGKNYLKDRIVCEILEAGALSWYNALNGDVLFLFDAYGKLGTYIASAMTVNDVCEAIQSFQKEFLIKGYSIEVDVKAIVTVRLELSNQVKQELIKHLEAFRYGRGIDISDSMVKKLKNCLS